MRKYILLIFAMILLVPMVKANWATVLENSGLAPNLANITTRSYPLSFHPDPLAKQSLYFNGTGTGAGGGSDSYVFGNTSAVWGLNNGSETNFTLEFFIWSNITSIGGGVNYIFSFSTLTTRVISFVMEQSGGDLFLRLDMNAADFSMFTRINQWAKSPGPQAYNGSAWNHIALTIYNTTANGTNHRFINTYFQGNWTATYIINNATFQQQINSITLGGSAVSGANNNLHNTGIDEIRISNVSRYVNVTGGFTPPSTAFLNDSSTIGLFHLDNDDLSSFGIRSCSAPDFDEALAINFTFWDEGNQTRFTNITRFDATLITISLDNTTNAQNLSIGVNNPNAIGICIKPRSDTFQINATIKYAKEGWNFRHFHSVFQNYTSVTINETLYLLQDDVATAITIIVVDSIDTPLRDFITQIEKFYIQNNTWIPVASIKSGEDGQDVVYLQQNEIDYRFRVSLLGVLQKLTTGQKLTATTYTIKIAPTTLTDLIANIKDIKTNISFTNQTRTYNFGFFDPNGKMAGACLQTSLSNTTGKFFETTVCEYGSFRGIINVAVGNSSPSIALGYGYIIMNGSSLNFGQKTLEVIQGLTNNLSIWGKYGIYLLLILLIGFVMVFIGNPVSVVFALMIGLFFAWWMDIFTISTIVFTGVMIGLGVLMKELRS